MSTRETDWNRHPRFRGHVDVPFDIVGRVLVCAARGLSLDAVWRVPQDNAALSVFDHDGRSPMAQSINDTAHLDPPRR